MGPRDKPANRSRRHHYLPQFYSKQWAGSDGRLCEYSKPHRAVIERRKYPCQVGYKDDLYSVSGAPPKIASYIEDRFLKLLDQRAHDALQYLLAGRIEELDEDLRSGWARFIMAQLQRTPEKIAWLHNAWNANFEPNLKSIEREYDKMRRPSDPATFEEFKHQNADRLRAVGATQMLQAVMDLPNFGSHLVRMRWTVGTFDHYRFELLTSDRPVLISNGMRKSDSYVIIPIAPHMLFVASNNDDLPERMKRDNPQDLISRCNDMIVRQCQSFVYGTDGSQLRFVSNRLGLGAPQLITSSLHVPSNSTG